MSTITVKGSRASLRSRWRGMLRRSHLVIAAVALVALALSAVATNYFLASRFTPSVAVADYLAALSSGDTERAWSRAEVTSPGQPTTTNFIDQSAFRAALKAAPPKITNFEVVLTAYLDDSRAFVKVDYDTSAGTRQATFMAIRTGRSNFAFFPDWRVQLRPMLLTIDAPFATGVSIDGQAVAMQTGAPAVVGVLPLGHRIEFLGGDLFSHQTAIVDGLGASTATVTYEPALTDAGLAQAKAAVAAAFTSCSQQVGPTPDGCPQTANDLLNGHGLWTLVGDPTIGVQIRITDSKLVGVGHFQMVYAFHDGGRDALTHEISSGGFQADLRIRSGAISVDALHPATDVAPLERPSAATDQAALDAVRKAFAVCATATSTIPADCPQLLTSPVAENVRWKLTGDPTTNATVEFDPVSGVYTAHGHFDMMATYTINGFPESDTSFYPYFDALLLWDGAKFQLVTIQSSNS